MVLRQEASGGRRDFEGSENEVYDTVDRKHNKEPHNSVKNGLFAFLSICFAIGRPDEFGYAVEQHNRRHHKPENYHGIQDKLIYVCKQLSD